LQTLTLTDEKLDTQLLFELFKPGRQVRWHPVQAFGGAGDRPFFGHGLKNPQLAEFHELSPEQNKLLTIIQF
jgi:hypothetical protein